MDKNAIVIGAGIGGLAASIRLRMQGYNVQVFEKNSYPGGKLSDFTQNGYHFDAGPSLFTQPQHIEAIFKLTGEPISQYIEYVQVPVACHYFFSIGKQVKAWADTQKFATEMETQLGEPAKHVTDYLIASKKLYEDVGSLFLEHSLHRPFDFKLAQIFKALSTVKMPYLFGSLHKHNTSNFNTPEAAQLFNRYATYNGSNPYKAPAMLSLIPHLEMNEGTFYPKGGMVKITAALYKLAAKIGVDVVLNSQVEKILVDHKKVTGVVAAGKSFSSDVVVSNQDVYFTYLHLLDQPLKAKHVLKQERSSSALIFYWGINHSFAELGLHNIFFTNNYEAEFDCIFNKGTVYNDPTVYINITSKMEAGLAPSGKENWFVMVNVPANTGQDWEKLQQQTRLAVLKKLSSRLGQNIEALIETESVLDPKSIESKTLSYQGSLYGTSSNSKFAAFLRQPNFSKELKGLYFVGGSVHPGGGIPLCLRSAAIMSEIIAKTAS